MLNNFLQPEDSSTFSGLRYLLRVTGMPSNGDRDADVVSIINMLKEGSTSGGSGPTEEESVTLNANVSLDDVRLNSY